MLLLLGRQMRPKKTEMRMRMMKRKRKEQRRPQRRAPAWLRGGLRGTERPHGPPEREWDSLRIK
jgi:hypothetical protein